MTPKQRVDMRKRQRADQEAERIKRAVADNYSEGRKRFREHRKKQVILYYLSYTLSLSLSLSLSIRMHPIIKGFNYIIMLLCRRR